MCVFSSVTSDLKPPPPPQKRLSQLYVQIYEVACVASTKRFHNPPLFLISDDRGRRRAQASADGGQERPQRSESRGGRAEPAGLRKFVALFLIFSSSAAPPSTSFHSS